MFTEMTEQRELKKKATKAAIRFYEGRDYEVIGYTGEFDIIAFDEDTIVFTDLFVQDRLDEPCIDRREVEMRMLRSLVENYEWTDMPIRYDRIIMVVLDGDRALIKHHINALGWDH